MQYVQYIYRHIEGNFTQTGRLGEKKVPSLIKPNLKFKYLVGENWADSTMC
jgi:hypothetical protein